MCLIKACQTPILLFVLISYLRTLQENISKRYLTQKMTISKINIWLNIKTTGCQKTRKFFINSVKYSRFATENLELRQTSLSNQTQQNNDSYVNNLCNIYIEAGIKTNMCRKTKTKIHHTQRRRYTKKKWYNTECESMRKPYFKKKHELSKTVSICEAADIQLNELFKQFKKSLKNAQVQYKRTFHSDLRTMRSKKKKRILETIKWTE